MCRAPASSATPAAQPTVFVPGLTTDGFFLLIGMTGKASR